MKEKLKNLYYYYMRAMWYMGIAKTEVTKPLQFWNETAILLLLLGSRGLEPPISLVITIYIIGFIGFVIAGKIMVIIGMVRYNNRLGNSQNSELMRILTKLENIEKKLEIHDIHTNNNLDNSEL